MSKKLGVAVKKPESKGKEPAFLKTKAGISPSVGFNSPVEQILHLQRTIGNQAVTRLIRSGVLQAKLSIGQPGDIYEQEADRVAEQVMRMTEEKQSLVNGHSSSVQRQSGCPGCEEEEKPIARKAAGNCNGGPDIMSCVESHINALKGGGQSLSPSTRSFFEPRFGSDFSNVRVHTGSDAGAIATEINAKAFTTGRDIFFGAGQYLPGTTSGKNLLAHELTHVIQQSCQGQVLQRFVTCEGPDTCPRRNHRELERSRSTPHQVEIYQPTTFGILISNFAIDQQNVKADLAGNPTWIAFIRDMANPGRGEWEILGFSDCLGIEARNRSLRLNRAADIALLLSSTRARVTNINAAALSDCIASNSSEAGRSQNRSVLIRRLPGSTGPTAPTGSRPIGPVRPAGAPGNFCVPYSPYTFGVEAAADRLMLENVWLPLANSQFGTEVHALWRDYLNRPKGASLAPRIFRGIGNRIVEAFRIDPDTVLHQGVLYANIVAAARRTPEANVPFTGRTYMSPPIELGTLLPAASLIRTINYRDPATRIPGNIAGGTGVMGTGSSDAGPDLRLFTGTIQILRTQSLSGGPEVKEVKIDMQLQVIDCVDFCPGAAGGFIAQQFTIPMSRLEATPTERTYDLPFHVFVEWSDVRRIP